MHAGWGGSEISLWLKQTSTPVGSLAGQFYNGQT